MPRTRLIKIKHRRKTVKDSYRYAVIPLRDEATCQNCGKKGEIFGIFPSVQIRENIKDKWIAFEIHHIIPVARGGTNHLQNLTLLCQNCNRKLGDRIL